MTHAVTLTFEIRPIEIVDGLAVEVFATEDEALAAFATAPSYVEQQAAAFAAVPPSLASEGEEGATHVWLW